MKLALVVSDEQKQELLSRPFMEDTEILWLEKPVLVPGVVGYFDFFYEEDNHEELLIQQQKLGSLVFVSALLQKTGELPAGFIRINGWTGFLEKEKIEMTIGNPADLEKSEQIIGALNRKAEWVMDQIGFIAPKVIATIINEAYYALQEGVSDKKQIDTAMKLGTNYPLGPFAWAEKIGIKKIHQLLNKLAEEEVRYGPAHLLTEEATR